MENPDRKVNKEDIHPRVPIKTYKWEDVKRSRTKGGYPWTYLYKQPFDEELDPEPYTMEGMRKSKSSSTMGKSDVEISEVMETENHLHAGEQLEKSDDLQIITEPDDHSIKHSSSSLVIEECDSNNKEKQGPGIFFLESAESSDDISQYLDKEDRSPTGKRKEHESEIDITMEVDEKDDEPQTRKRKLSAESSYSRISQTKSAILKKIRDTKAKIKVPKLSFPTSKLKKPAQKKKNNSPPETKKEIKKSNSPPRNVKPLYIHIPLKPPPGMTDEFSHLESGSDQAKKYQQKKPGSFRNLVKNIKQLKEAESEYIKEETETEAKAEADIDTENHAAENAEDEVISDTEAEIDADTKTGENTKTDANGTVEAKEKVKTIFKEKPDTEIATDIKIEADTVAEVEIKTESDYREEAGVNIKTDNKEEAQIMDELITEVAINDGKKDIKIEDDTLEDVSDHQTHQQLETKSFGEFDPVIFKAQETLKHDNSSKPTEAEEEQNNDAQVDTMKYNAMFNSFKAQETLEHDSSSKSTEAEEEENNDAQVDNTKYNDMFDKLFDATTSKDTETQTQSDRKGRSKSAEPERKRKISLESSYSRKSLSKLGLMKKLKDASDKIKRTLSRSTFKKEAKPKEEKIEKAPQKSKQLKPVKPIEPVYIHIPLKAPEEENDDFSQLQVDEGFKTPDTDSTTPDSPAQTGVQFIFLTAPSDDETLDYNSSDVAETPSSENKRFFGSKISELKELAKGAVDEIAYPKHKLDPVSEESSSDKVSVEGGNNQQEIKVMELPDDKSITKELEVRGSDIVRDEEMVSAQVQPEENATSRDSDKDNVLVDEEDGLSEPKATKKENLPKEKSAITAPPAEAEDKDNHLQITTPANKEEVSDALSPELKSSLKGDGSPVMKKKVSFKRRTKASKDGSYEDVQVISSDGDQKKEMKFQPGVLENTQSMSVDEKKSYLDDKIVESVPPGEDYNKWSKISDHEYEPVNPPPENIEITPRGKLSENPTVCVINTDQILNNSQVLNFTQEEAYKQDPAFLLKFQKDSKLVHRPPTAPKTSESPSEFKLEEPYMQDPAFQLKFKKDSKQPGSKSGHGPSKFQQAIKHRADNFKTRLHNIKKPHITLPDRPKFHKPNFQKFSLPKIPDRAKINLPSFNLPQRNSAKRPARERHLSTESNEGDSKKPIFDFSTYPRIFKKKPKDQARIEEEIPSFATVPRSKKPDKPKTDDSRWSAGSESMRVPLHSEDSMDADYRGDNNKERYIRGDSIDDNEPSHIRYDEDIDSDDEYDRENRELNRDRDFLRRWDQGTYNTEDHEYIENMRNKQQRITDLDSPEEPPAKGYQFRTNINNGDHYSSGSSQGMHRQGVLEEINSDEFFLRQKGISQDNIEVGMYLSSEIREAFRTPVNALSQMQGNNNYELRASNMSLPEMPAKRKSLKKPKRKKTPHTSQEKIPYDEESAEDDLGMFPPPRPRRHSRRGNKQKNADNLIPYQETISVDTPADRRLTQHRESLGILADDEQDEDGIAYVNEKMEGKEPLNIRITDPYRNFEFVDDEDNMDESPALKSLNMSESDSIMGDFSSNRAIFNSEKDIHEPEVEAIRAGSKIIIPIQTDIPKRPSRMRSRTNSQSRGTSQKDDESLSLNTESIASENQIPCVEEPCIRDLRDSMGYAIIDKSKARDPPLPPPRIPTRRKRSFRSENNGHFSTVPRSSRINDTPVRPLRNYSTLGQTRRSNHSNTYENKENIDITQYIEMEDEHNRDLQSGAVINRMKDRPLPAPPRPPRKSRPFRDITSQDNITTTSTTELDKINTEEAEVSTQTEPLPDDFICEEVVQEPTDTIIIPTKNQNKPPVLPDHIFEQMVLVSRPERKAPKALPEDQLCEEVVSSREEKEKTTAERKSYQTDRFIPEEGPKEVTEAIITPVVQEKPTIVRRLITPSVYSYEETITHGSLVVQPLDGAKLLPDSDISNVKVVPVHVDSDLEETSSIPEEFNKLIDAPPETKPTRVTESAVKMNEFDVLKANKLQVADLDVDKLTVNKLLADKIIVSEIDSSTIQTNEISSKTGALKVGEITLPAEVITKIIETLKSSQIEETGNSDVQKKTPISDYSDVSSPNCEELSTLKNHSFEEEKNVGHSDVINHPFNAPNENAPENLLPLPESSRIPQQESPEELGVQENPVEEVSVQENLPEGSNVHEGPREELSVQENLPEMSNVHDSPREVLGVQDNLPEGTNVHESPREVLGVQENLPERSNVHESPREVLGVQENLPEGPNVYECPREELGVQESLSRDVIIQECPFEDLKKTDSISDESRAELHSSEDVNVQTDASENVHVQESLVEDSNVQASIPIDPNVQKYQYESSNVQENHSRDLNLQEDADELEVQESPPKPPPRSSDSNTSQRKEASDTPPHRPPRQSEKHRTGSSSNQEEFLQEPDIDDVPPPRPPQPQLEYIPSQPPASFYALRAQKYVETFGESIPTVPRRKRHSKSKQLARSSSEESSVVSPPSRRFLRRSSDVSIANLSGQLVRVCSAEVNNSLKRLITYILNNVAKNEDGKQDLNVMIMIVVVLIAGLILLGYGDEKTVVHLHHWEYFNPPGDT